MTDSEQALRTELVEAARALDRLGLNQGRSGNVSVRSGDGFLITPSGVATDALTPDGIAHMELGGSYAGPLPPSSEWRMHLAIYRDRPEAGAVVHTHATFSTALACLRQEIPPFHYMVAMAGGRTIRCADYATFGTDDLSQAMMRALDGRRACLLANHGMIAFGASLRKAVDLAVEVETLARQYWYARSLGAPVLLSPGQMAEVEARFAAYGRPPDEMPPGAAELLGFPPRRG
jgi:L-fuculose-phosphate aldolase